MTSGLDTYEFHFSLNPDHEDGAGISLKAIRSAIDELEDILEGIESSTQSNMQVHWEYGGEPTVTVVARVNGATREDLDTIVGSAVDGFRAAASPNESAWPSNIPQQARRKIERLVASLKRVADIEVSASNRDRFTIEKDESARAPRIATLLAEHSAVDGELQIISAHGSLTIVVFEHGTGVRVRCRLSDDHLKQAKDLFGKRVVVDGMVRYRTDGTPVSIVEVNSLLPVTEPQYTVEQLRGSFPDLSGDVGSAEMIRREREPDSDE